MDDHLKQADQQANGPMQMQFSVAHYICSCDLWPIIVHVVPPGYLDPQYLVTT